MLPLQGYKDLSSLRQDPCYNEVIFENDFNQVKISTHVSVFVCAASGTTGSCLKPLATVVK